MEKLYRIELRGTKVVEHIHADSAQEACEKVGLLIGDCYVSETPPIVKECFFCGKELNYTYLMCSRALPCNPKKICGIFSCGPCCRKTPAAKKHTWTTRGSTV